MNGNRGNNRRRGRGNRPQGSGHQQINRIDSRARGNAPQLLEKYRKLAHDAHLNGDRVQEETYLQFADHYFRVLADQRQRQEELRGPRRDERWQEGGDSPTYREEGEDGGDYPGDNEYSTYDQPAYNQPAYARREREERPVEEAPRGEEPGEERSEESGDESAERPSIYEPPENPFIREPRQQRGLRPRRDDRRPRRDDAQDRPLAEADEPVGLDPSSLPPPISVARGEEAGDSGEDEAKPRRRTRRPRPAADDAGEAVEALG